MTWVVEFHDAFYEEFMLLDEEIQDSISQRILLLEKIGINLGRPYVDTLNASKFSNMKEMRFNANNEVWRIAFAFDPKRQAILLCGGDKKGKDQKRFYDKLIKLADLRFTQHLEKTK